MLARCSCAGELVVEHVFDQRALAAAADAGDGGERAERNCDVDVLEVVVAGAEDLEAGQDAGCGGRKSSSDVFALRLLRFDILHSPTPASAIRRFVGTGIAFLPLKIRPGDAAVVLARLASGVPRATIWPPRRPAPGPKSSRPSALAITSRSCSTTSSVLPRSRSLCSASSSRVLSRGCRPIVGSSSTYSTPHRPLPTWLARRMRCASPPESVGAGAAEREIFEADVDQEREAVVDLADQLAGDLLLARGRASSFSTCASSSPSGSAADLVDVRSRNRTAAASSRSRLPPHSLQSISSTRCSSSAAQARRELRGFFEGRVEAFVLKAERADARFDVRVRLPPSRFRLATSRSTSIHSSPVPYSTVRRWRGERSLNGTSSGTPVCAAERREHRVRTAAGSTSGHTSSAPSASVSFGSRSSAAGFAPVCVPRPSHAGHQPSELLNEKLCGVSGSKLRPHLSQARCWL